MKQYSIFDIVGPIMIGPSSSHTAGAARLAKTARIISGGNIKNVTFLLHGSFAKTYKGHGTDRALVAGILKMNPWDERLKDSFTWAEKKGIEFEFIETDLGNVHPNTVKFVITKKDGSISEITGSSVGGGNILIFDIDGTQVEFTGDNPTIITKHRDVPGVIWHISKVLFEKNINIGNMKVFQKKKGLEATMVIETDAIVSEEIIKKIKDLSAIEYIKILNPMMEGE
ncbi:L-serine ammonia-lyase, iron-sulfur-dependent, subunit beta [Crassaminicella thermophila]|uniref:L-serine deaminase n=1 Tax=Crassaminicella thermophila TaxID=2599308 RepID=A0A5C0SG46_CRATE|nr:L-serine ammonia-lyase, iron-sulfur-dependent subunit beta [Crassaminicella thermophila]QEK12902.1 L-serine ammonia-lyase, iron-sulfur-dependent, subunit beta [Crassaminicella thermophila]